MKYCVIANEETADGFAIFGTQSIVVSGEEQARAAFEHAVNDDGLGAVILSREVGALIDDAVCAHIASCRLPQVLVLDI